MLKLTAEAMVIILLLANFFGNRCKKEKHVSDWLVVARITYFVLLALSVVKLILNFPVVLILNILWLLYLIAVYILLENTFRLKRETFGNPLRAAGVTIALVIALVIIIVFF
ncbi:hypothetical protein [Limosilactobacillus sp.]|uniref:hypothetical protein n=1 Tax=Limosilactobacillus sp. TaxID=2773925 RepID=UPI003F115763